MKTSRMLAGASGILFLMIPPGKVMADGMTPAQQGAYLFQRGSYINRQVYTAEQMIARGQYESAISILKPFVDSGESDTAIYDMALLYADGKGVPQDIVQARTYMEKIEGRFRLAHEWLIAQGYVAGAQRVWSVAQCAKAIESRDTDAKYDGMQKFCPDMRDPTTAQFEIELGDKLLHQYDDRRVALLQYNNAAQKGSPDAAGRIAALNALPPAQPARLAPKSLNDQAEAFCGDVGKRDTTMRGIFQHSMCVSLVRLAATKCFLMTRQGGDTNACLERMIKQARASEKAAHRKSHSVPTVPGPAAAR